MRRALAYGLLASLFFAFTFIFNRSMNLDGGYWLWSAALRFIFMLPIMGVIATILFFEATNMVKNNPKHLAIIEATQSGEVIFTLIGGILFLGDAMPAGSGLVGILIIVAGMVLNSFLK